MVLPEDVAEADKGAAANEQHARGIDVVAALQLDRRTFHDLEQGVLHPLAGGPTCLGAGGLELIHFVDEDDAALRLVEITAGLFDQALQDGLDLLADILGLRQRRRISRDKRYIDDPRQCFAEQRLAGTGRAGQQDVALHHLNRFNRSFGRFLEVGIDGHRQNFLGILLPDHVVIEMLDDFAGFHGIPLTPLDRTVPLQGDFRV